jgi:hypothetical protein
MWLTKWSGALKGPTITVDLGTLPSSAFREEKVGGFLGIGRTPTYMSEFTFEMVTESASFRFEIRHNGKLLASQKVDSCFVGTSE